MKIYFTIISAVDAALSVYEFQIGHIRWGLFLAAMSSLCLFVALEYKENVDETNED